MNDKPLHLTKSQVDTFCNYIDNDDRTRGYIELAHYTKFPAALNLMHISQFSGVIGGIAEGANNIAAANNDLYPKEGVIYFSKYIANAQKDYIKTQYDKGEAITNEGIIQAAKMAWNDFGLTNEFPGNPISATHHFKTGLNDLFSKGTINTALGAVTNMFGGRELEDFTTSPNAKDYNIQYTPDYSIRYVTDKDGKTVFSESTGAVLDEATGTYVYTYSFASSPNNIPTNKAEAAARLGVSPEQIEENYNAFAIRTEYSISHEVKTFKAEDFKPEVNRILKNANGGGETIIDQVSSFSRQDTNKAENVFSIKEAKAALARFEEIANKYQEDLKKSKEAEELYLKDQTEKNKLSKDESYKNACTSLNILASDLEKIGRFSNDRDLMKAGAVLGSFAGMGVSLAQLGVISGATQVMTGFAVIFPAFALAAGAVAIFSILSSDDDNSMGEALEQIMGYLNVIRTEMHEQFQEVHKKLFQMYDLLYKHHLDNSIRSESIQKLLQFSIIELSNLVKLDIFIEPYKILHKVKSEILPRNADKFRDDLETLDSSARSTSKENEFNGDNLKSDSILDVDTQNQITSRQTPINNIAFFIKYAKDILEIEGLPKASSVPNFNIFYKISQPLLQMIAQAIKYDAKIINPKDRLIDNKNKEYLEIILKELALDNNKIHDVVTTLRNSDVIDKLINNYKDTLNNFSNYINTKMEEYSVSLKKSELGNEYSIFNPNYPEIYKVSSLEFSNNWETCGIDFNIPFMGENVRFQRQTGYNSQYKCYEAVKNEFFHPHQIWLSSFQIEIQPRQLWHSQNYHVNVNGFLIESDASKEVMDKVRNKLLLLRNEFFNKLTMEDQYRKHIDKIAIHENLIKMYGQILGESLPLNLTKNIHEHVMDLSKTPAGENIPKLADYQSIIDDSNKIDAAYEEWKKSENPYKNYALHFKNMIEIVGSFTSIIEANNASQTQESSQSSYNPQDVAIIIEKVYLKLKSFFQEIIELSDDVKDLLEGKKLDKFNFLLNKVQIEETSKDISIPDGLDLQQLQNRYCEVHCVDKYAKFHVEFYRSGMRDDYNMEYLSGAIKELNDGEFIACEC